MNNETENLVPLGSDALFGSVFATMPDGNREQLRSDSRAGLARAVLDFRTRGGTDINVIDPWLPKSKPNTKDQGA